MRVVSRCETSTRLNLWTTAFDTGHWANVPKIVPLWLVNSINIVRCSKDIPSGNGMGTFSICAAANIVQERTIDMHIPWSRRLLTMKIAPMVWVDLRRIVINSKRAGWSGNPGSIDRNLALRSEIWTRRCGMHVAQKGRQLSHLPSRPTCPHFWVPKEYHSNMLLYLMKCATYLSRSLSHSWIRDSFIAIALTSMPVVDTGASMGTGRPKRSLVIHSDQRSAIRPACAPWRVPNDQASPLQSYSYWNAGRPLFGVML